MREIKLRAWIKLGSKYQKYTGLYSVVSISFTEQYHGKRGFILVERASVFAHTCFPLSEVELMQYTGLKDKNGVEIFEGDIVEFNCPEGLVKQQVTFNKGAFITESGRMWGFEESTGNLGFYEVIGNIHQDSKLLEEK